MPHKAHTFTKFDDELNSIHQHIMEMSLLVKTQLDQSLTALFESKPVIANQVIDRDFSVNQLEVLIDRLCFTAIARQQPAASDLQSIIIATKVVVHLEHIGDEAKKIARIAERIAYRNGLPKQRFVEVGIAAELARQKLAEVIDSYSRLDKSISFKLMDAEDLINEKIEVVSNSLLAIMTEDPRTISTSLEILFVAKAIERVGNHIKHIAKLVIDASDRYGEI